MQISKKAIEEFKEIYREEFGKDISDQTALELGTNLLNIFSTVYRPISKNKLTKINMEINGIQNDKRKKF